MIVNFPANEHGNRGYHCREVKTFLALARATYDRNLLQKPSLTAENIRKKCFTLVARGYDATHVDQALNRLEDAFSLREREVALAAIGQEFWLAQNRADAQVILDQLERAAGARFKRRGHFGRGYSVAEVDRFVGLISDYFQHDQPLTLSQVRSVVFTAKCHGYSVTQVDQMLDDVVRIMLAIR